MPALQFNWFFAFLMGTAGIAVCLLFLFGFYAAIPPRVTVSSKNVAIQHGQVISVFKHADIKAVHHVFRSNGRHYLRIETVKSQRRIGLSPKVSLDALAEHFGEKVVVHDRRKGKSSCAV
ncbi:MAG TPA: hypothetical protein VFW87_01710 [Pirellulales bacterium]|nr:hypothetical protein [Pirellulales bacterium]